MTPYEPILDEPPADLTDEQVQEQSLYASLPPEEEVETPLKTREEVEALKLSWLRDPCWDIEDTEGFEDYREELRQYHGTQKVIWDNERAETEERQRQQKRRAFSVEALHDDIDAACFRLGRLDDRGEMTGAEFAQIDAILILAKCVLSVAQQISNLPLE